jgi:tetratricopeptide (TPR) repeat protein
VSNRLGLGVAAAALGVFGLASMSSAIAQGACTGNGKISKQIAKPMKAAQDALNAKQWSTALAKSRESDAAPTKTGFDQYMIHEFQGFAYSQLKQYAEAGREFEAGLTSGCMPESDKPNRYKVLTQVYYQIKNYTKVIEYGNRAMKAGADDDLALFVGQAYYITNDNKSALRVMSDVVAADEQRGKAPGEQTLLIIQSACSKLGDNACVTKQFEKLVSHYPKPEYWKNLVFSLMAGDSNDKQLLNVMRLATFVDVMQQPEQYTEMAQLALEQGLPGEAQAVLEQGFAKGIFKEARDKDRNQRLLASAKTQAAPDKASLDKQDAAAKAKPTGEADVKLGAAYLSYGEPAKAVEVLNRGITKGGVKDADEAGLLLGIAYLRAGNKPEAAKAFRTVKADPTMSRIAKLFLLNT